MGRILTKNENRAETRGQAGEAKTLAEPNRAFVIGSWVAVAVVAAFIFAMSARDGYQIDYGSGIFSQVKQWLSEQALALTGHEVDVSPVGHFCE